MNKLFTLFLFLTLGFTSLQAQLETAYLKTYDDNFIDTVGRGEDLIRLSNGNFALASRKNSNGIENNVASVDIFNSQLELLHSISTDGGGSTTALTIKIAEAPDSTIWIAYRSTTTALDKRNDDKTRIVQFSSNLDAVLQDVELDLYPGVFEYPISMLIEGDQLILLINGAAFDENRGFNINAYSLFDFDTRDLTIDQRRDDVFPRNSRINNTLSTINLVEPGKIGAGILTRDSATFAITGFILKEVDLSDFSMDEEFFIEELGNFSTSLDLAYVPGVDAYAITSASFDTYLIKRGTGINPTIDTISVPAGVRGDRSSSRLTFRDSTLYVFGRNAYQIDFANDTVSNVATIEGFNNNAFRLYEIDDEKNIINVNTFPSTRQGLRVLLFADSVSAFTDTLDIVSPLSGAGVSQYFAVSLIPSLSDTLPPFFAIGQAGQVGSRGQTNGYEIVDSETGDLTGQTYSTGDIEFWDNEDFLDPLIYPLIPAGDTYMTVVNEFDNFTVFKFNDSLQAQQPSSSGFGRIQFDPRPSNVNRDAKIAATSYGLLGITMGERRDENFNSTFKPYLFAADTNFVTQLALTVDTLSFYGFGVPALVVDSLDRPYFASPGGVAFNQSDSIHVLGHQADGSVRFATSIGLSGGQFAAIGDLEFNSDQTELLLSGTYRDTTTQNTFGFLVRIAVADGSVQELTSYNPVDLGYSATADLVSHQALYDAADNITLGLQISDFNNPQIAAGQEVRIIQLDSAGTIMENHRVFDFNRFLQNFNLDRIGDALYVSGSYNTFSNLQQQVIIAKVNSGLLTDTEEAIENLTKERQLTAFPNPVNDQVTLTWEQPKASDYSLQLFDMTGRTLKRWIGNQGAGTAQIEVPMAELPKGPYFIRLDVADGYMVRTIVKQ